jgi:hypothetical protein
MKRQQQAIYRLGAFPDLGDPGPVLQFISKVPTAHSGCRTQISAFFESIARMMAEVWSVSSVAKSGSYSVV